MNEDQLLKELGDLARRQSESEEARFDDRWDRLAAGTLSPEEDAELRALAATSDAMREAYEAFRPLGPDLQARVVSAITSELATAEPAEPQPVRARVLPFRRKRIEVWIGAAAAAAAAVLFLVLRNPVQPPLPGPLPGYKAELSGGSQEMRGGVPVPSQGLPVFVRGSLLTLVARPQQEVAGTIAARAFLGPVTGAGDIVPWQPEPPIEVSNGAVRLRGTVGQEVRLPAGPWRVWLVVGRPGQLPSAGGLSAAVREGRTHAPGWLAVAADLRVE